MAYLFLFVAVNTIYREVLVKNSLCQDAEMESSCKEVGETN